MKRKMRRVREKIVRVMILTEEGVFRISKDFTIDNMERERERDMKMDLVFFIFFLVWMV